MLVVLFVYFFALFCVFVVKVSLSALHSTGVSWLFLILRSYESHWARPFRTIEPNSGHFDVRGIPSIGAFDWLVGWLVGWFLNVLVND